MSFTPISLQATRANPDGSPASGTISFTLNAEMSNGTESIQPAPISGVLNPQGQLVQQNGQAIILLANDDEGTTPADPSAAYVVQENINGSSVVEYSIIILHDSTITDEAVIFTATKDTVTLSNVLASAAMVGQTLVDSTNFPSGVGITAYDPTQNTLTLASNATSTVTESATISGAVDLSTLAQYEPAPEVITYIPFTLDPAQSDGQVPTWNATDKRWEPTTPGGGALPLSYNGQTFDVPVSSLPAGWNGEGIGSLFAQLTTGPTLVSGLLDSYGNPIPDGFTFPATIFVEGSTIYDIVVQNAFVYGNPGQSGYSWWGSNGGSPVANIGPNALIIQNLPTGDPEIAGAFWNYNGQIVASGFTPLSPGVSIIDLGLVNLVDAVMNGPQPLYDMPEGSFLASLRFTDDPATVQPDLSGPWSNTSGSGAYLWPAFGTVKSFGWGGFASMNNTGGFTAPIVSDSTYLASIAAGYGPFAALDAGNLQDLRSLVLSAAVVGPIQCALMCAPFDFASGMGQGVRVAAITPWVAATNYDSPASNTFATPGVLQKCAILENGTIWVNDGTSGTSGGSAPDFAGNAGGSVSDGPDIVWYDTTSPPPTVGAVHVVAEIWTPS